MDHRQRGALGRARAEQRNVERRTHAGDLMSGCRHEVCALTERARAAAEIGLTFALAGHDEMDIIAAEPDEGIDRDVVALLAMKSGNAADHRGVSRDPLLAPYPSPAGLAEARLRDRERVRHDVHLPPGHAEGADLITRSRGNRKDQIGPARGA